MKPTTSSDLNDPYRWWLKLNTPLSFSTVTSVVGIQLVMVAMPVNKFDSVDSRRLGPSKDGPGYQEHVGGSVFSGKQHGIGLGNKLCLYPLWFTWSKF